MFGAAAGGAKHERLGMTRYGPENFAADFAVSRETMARLERFAALLGAWRERINLVSRASLEDVWLRHIADSAQILPLLGAASKPSARRPILDLGSGAGFPGLVLAILGAQHVWLVESDARKCAFLAEASRSTGAEVKIVRSRIESLEPLAACAMVARALKPLKPLLDLAQPLIAPDTLAIFLKGQDVELELTEATKYWNMDVEKTASRTSESGVILSIRGVSRIR